MDWDPDRYHRFREEREAPFADLLPLIERRAGLQVIDLGCGSGELTRRLADALPGSDVLGVDSSDEMLARAAAHASSGLVFARTRIEDVVGQWDLVFSNAALHWVADHESLVPRLLGLVRPGGQLVAQIPANHDHPAHCQIPGVAGEEPFRTALGGWARRSPVLPLADYAELLFAHGGRSLTLVEEIYPHVLDDAAAIGAWLRSTTLLPYLERLPEALHQPFLARLLERLRALYPGSPVFYGFRRIVFAASVP